MQVEIPRWVGRTVLMAAIAVLLGSSAEALASPGFVDFEGLTPFTDSATVDFPGVSISTAFVLDEVNAAAVTGFPTAGTWATSGSFGLLNSLDAIIRLSFDVYVIDFAVEILGLPVLGGGFQTVLLEAYREGDLVGLALSDDANLGDSLLHEQTLTVAAAAIDEIHLLPVVATSCTTGICLEPGPSTSFFLDDVRFTSVPEPGVSLQLALGLGALALKRRWGLVGAWGVKP